MSWVEFDLARHPVGDLHEGLSEKLHRAEPGTDVAFPSGTHIHKEGNSTFHLHNRAGKHISTHDEADEAATHALNMEAQSHHPASLGGGKSYHSFAEYRKSR